MSPITPLMPRQPVPQLELPTLGGETWSLQQATPERFSMLVFYRGYHCPICSRYLGELEGKLDDFASRGVEVTAISSDGEQRAAQAKKDWKLDSLRIAWGLDLEQAREWGLYLSGGRGKTSAGVEEPALFSEPGLFLVRPGGELFFASVQSMPFARPSFRELLPALDFVIERNYPARGEIVDHRAAS